MTDPTAPVEINVAELTTHQQKLGAVVDRVGIAHEAAGAPIGQDAFGAFGHFLAQDCASAVADGSEMLAAAHEAAEELREKLGIWARDVDATEGEIMALFSTAPEMRGA